MATTVAPFVVVFFNVESNAGKKQKRTLKKLLDQTSCIWQQLATVASLRVT